MEGFRSTRDGFRLVRDRAVTKPVSCVLQRHGEAPSSRGDRATGRTNTTWGLHKQFWQSASRPRRCSARHSAYFRATTTPASFELVESREASRTAGSGCLGWIKTCVRVDRLCEALLEISGAKHVRMRGWPRQRRQRIPRGRSALGVRDPNGGRASKLPGHEIRRPGHVGDVAHDLRPRLVVQALVVGSDELLV